MTDLTNALKQFGQALKARLQVPYNSRGRLLMGSQAGLSARPAVVPVGFVETDEELSFQQSETESFETVFNSWQRISRQGYNTTDEANPSELNAWSYDSVNDRVVCTINSATLLGFISDERYNNYVLESRINSNNSDDDFIGLCIAHAMDAQGNTHILTAMRGYNGRAPLTIDKNLLALGANTWITGASEYEVARVYAGLQWADGSVTTEPIANSSRGGWNAVPDGVLLKITRTDDLVTVETSLNNGVNYHEPAKVVIDLAADPELEIFRGPQRYGYVCFSQVNSTFDVLQRSGERQPIIDTRTMTLYEYQNNGWVNRGSGLPTLIANGALIPNQLHYNPVTGRFYYLQGSETLRRIQPT